MTLDFEILLKLNNTKIFSFQVFKIIFSYYGDYSKLKNYKYNIK